MLYSSDKLKTGETYTVYASGEEVGSAEIESSITKIGTKSNSGFGGGHRQKQRIIQLTQVQQINK